MSGCYFKKDNRKRAYQLVKDLTTVKQGKATTVQDSSGTCLTEEREILTRWTEYCTVTRPMEISVLDYPQRRTTKFGRPQPSHYKNKCQGMGSSTVLDPATLSEAALPQPTHYTRKIARGFGKYAGEWTGRVEIDKEEIPGSKCSQ